MMRGVGGVRKSIDQSFFVQRVRVRVVEALRELSKRFRRKSPALFKSGQWHFQRDNAPFHNPIFVTDCDIWLVPKPRGYRYETIEEMK